MIEKGFTIPSMGGGQLKDLFKQFASEAENDTAIVELGTWLGAGTHSLIQGVAKSGNNVEIHSYDNFVIRGNEVDKAAKFGVTLKPNQDCLPLVEKWLSGYNVNINLHKGELTDTTWNKKPISLYIDDACKYEENFIKALKIFSPYWIPGKTKIVLMDFYFYLIRDYDQGLRFQKEFMDLHKNCFTQIYENKKLCTAIFQYEGGLKL